ncbi:hypothetical protein [Streptosporangium sp. NPDC049644]|uniref:hypothetical protein n=1 Tax=Streptosporangium sp. NPDC049644 TaxID=3155507 RepID=UPI00341285FA
MRAVTDTDTVVSYDPERKPGVFNLLAILAACTGDEPQRLAGRFDRYGELKEAVADAVVATLAPLRDRYLRLAEDPRHVQAVLRTGADRTRGPAGAKVRQAKAAIGLLPG